MRKLKLVKGTVKKAIAVASVLMLTCSVEAGTISGAQIAYAEEIQETNVGGGSVENGDGNLDGTDENGGSEVKEGSEATNGAGETGSSETTDGTGETGNSETTDGAGETGSSETTDGTGETGGSETTDGTGETGNSETTDGTGETGSSETTDGTGETGNSETTDGTGETGSSESTDGTGETGDSETADGTGETGGSEETDTSEKADDSNETGESSKTDESEKTESDVLKPDDALDNKETAGENVTADSVVKEQEKQLVNQIRTMAAQVPEENTWYITSDSYYAGEEDGYFYYTDTNKKITKKYLQSNDAIIYLDGDGKKVTKKWLEEDGKFRYVDGSGHVVINKDKLAGGYYGHFDLNGYWEAKRSEFFEYQLEGNGPTVTMYASEEGEVGSDGKSLGSRQYYCFVEEEGKTYCYLINLEMTEVTDKKAANTWVYDLYVNEDGSLVTDTENKQIGGLYYDFDMDGHGWLVADRLIENEAGKKIYINEEGKMAVNQFVDDGEHTLYFGEDGTQVFRRWIEDENGFRFINGKGYMIVDTIKEAGKYYGSYDENGYWTPIEHTFFSSELDDGTVIVKYAMKEGKVARTNGGQDYYFKKDAAGDTYCYLVSDDGETATNQLVTNTWIDDLRVNSKGCLYVNSTEKVDNIYYSFDEEGHCALVTYEISYRLYGGTNNSANPSEYTGETVSIKLAAPTRSGYLFDGWYTDSLFKNKITELVSRDNSEALVLYAKWTRENYDSDYGSDDDDSDDGWDSGSSSNSGATNNTDNSAVNNTSNNNANSNASASPVTSAKEGDNITVSTGQTSIEATVTQSTAGSVTGNTIVSTTAPAAVVVAEGHTAEVATIAVGADGSTRSLLASAVQGAVVTQTTVTVQGTTVSQKVVVYADGTQVSQKSGTTELEGFAEAVVSAEKAIQSGSNIAAVYNDKVELDLQQYVQVGAAVTYGVTAGTNGAAPQVQMEQTSFAAGQELVALITDANGNVVTTPIVVGANGVVQYQIPGVNCIVRFLQIAR